MSNSIPEYHCYNSHDTVMHMITSNGSWDFFPTKVTYEKYSLQDQPDRPEWTEYFQKKLDEILPDAPVIFEEAYFFDWNGDGTQSVIVNVGNMFEKELSTDFFEGYTLPNAPAPPTSVETALYQMSAIFTYEKNKTVTYSLLNSIYTVSAYTDESLYIPPEDDNNSYNLDYYSVQKAENDTLAICPVYANHVTWESLHQYAYNYTYLLSDINGDSKPELIVHWPIHYGLLEVLQSNDGKIEKVATITTL